MVRTAGPEAEFEEIVAGLGWEVEAKVRPYEDPIPVQEREREEESAPLHETEGAEKAPVERER
ncbi:hypothetical protein J0910_02385 [Nocardiopsis sp. CNT-189]|uniref:hypothetical protein n=1 Tax=Nocardiopsis oceanisediminis TaxID=2816862 RepID=UPI003B35D664